MKQYLYVTVRFDNMGIEMPRYICEDKKVKVGDTVLVDSKGEQKYAMVLSRNYYTADSVPYPLEKTKTVISVIPRKNDFNEDMIPGFKLNKYRKWITMTNEQRECSERLWIGDGCKHNFWYEVKTQEDAKLLLKRYGGFHDTYLIDIKSKNAMWANRDGFVVLSFTSCWVRPKLELKFAGLLRMNIVGGQYCPMYDCFLVLEDGKIIFADSACFNPQEIEKNAKDNSFIIANELSWRFIE